MNNKLGIALRILLLVVVAGVIGFVAWSCFHTEGNKTNPTIPSVEIAPFKITVKSTGNIYFSKLVVTTGDIVGQRTHTLKGFWEQKDGKYEFKDITVILKETEFGEIVIERRQ